MISFLHPWLFLLAVLPLLLRMVLPPFREPRQAVRVPWFRRVLDLVGGKAHEGAVVAETPWRTILFRYLLWLLLLTALARPQWVEPAISRVTPTRDLLLLVDLSGSMETKDFKNKEGEQVDRLTAVKEVLDDFLTRREGDRVGLIVFGNAAFVQVPFTQDLTVCRQLLDEMATRMAGPRTAFGDAIGLGITLFAKSENQDKLIIALTDGNDTGSKVPPAEAASIASDQGIMIHVVGVGDPAATGEEKLDEAALTQVAKNTGGSYFHANDRAELEGIYEQIDQMGTREIESESYRPRSDLFHWPLSLCLLLSLCAQLVTMLRTNRSGGAHV
ncbi:VWA domain-containing protein [Rubritalea marina]|uniref:VWA domain-containing protein n=1 Tax=Rubritalea marina TaxID=361055 RepID=UPI00037B90AD|nr:VWA domain-containing protein [Rubritalea marina]